MAKTFIKTAIEISNDYELDIEIEEHLSHISATYYFDCGACMGFLRRIIEMSDDKSQKDASAPTTLRANQIYHTVTGRIRALDESFIQLFTRSDLATQKSSLP